MYHYFYKITNNINGHFYYGIHSTDNLDDGYMGSGRYLRRAYKKFGIENFTKEIIKFFENREDCANFEKEIVTEELVNDPNCYNISLGGEQTSCKGTVSVYDKDEQIYKRVLIKDKSKYESINGGKVQVYDTIEKTYKRVSSEEYISNKDRYNSVNPFPKNSIFVYLKTDESKKVFLINKDDFDDKLHVISDNHFQKGKVLVKDANGQKYFVDINDERYLSGELLHISKGYKFTDEQRRKLKNKHKEMGYQRGERNSQFGTKWINKDGVTKKIKKDELQSYIENGWKLGKK